jgi:hypothetical protein
VWIEVADPQEADAGEIDPETDAPHWWKLLGDQAEIDFDTDYFPPGA